MFPSIFNTQATQTEATFSPQEDFVEAVLKTNCREAPKKLVEAITSVLKAYPLLSEAAIVRLANHLSITMFGRVISDLVTDQSGRKTYNLHPYRKAGSGAVCMATYTDLSNESYILFGQKAKAPGLLILLGGYFQPFPLAGHKEGVEKLTPEQKDQIEEAIIAGVVDAYGAFIQEVSSGERATSIIKWDENIEACAIRELGEEAGLNGIKPDFLMEQSRFPDTNPDLHSINLSYLFDCGRLPQAPSVAAGSDIKELTWVNIKDIKINSIDDEKHYSYQGMSIRKDHGPILEAGIKRLIEKNIHQLSDGLLTLDALEQKIKLLELRVEASERSLSKEKSASHLGIAASDYLQKLYKVAEGIRQAEEKQVYFGFKELKQCIERELVAHSGIGLRSI
ncbi:MAG: hypothetical protein K0S08_1125 [Gammaproteobacteria bacterium]|jgi:8-oxo-dGTP pyrophosphatase MutT (NUDIX family)|nr:hypothetical protein [Gammaproteobacteria bacterium]